MKSECRELVKLCHINCSGPVFWDTVYFAKSLEITQGHSKWHPWVRRVWVSMFVSDIYLCFWDIQRDLEIYRLGVAQGHRKCSHSVSYDLYYQSAIVTIAE